MSSKCLLIVHMSARFIFFFRMYFYTRKTLLNRSAVYIYHQCTVPLFRFSLVVKEIFVYILFFHFDIKH